MKERTRQDVIRWIETVLQDWDPIGVGQNVPDEYDSYAPHLADLLINDADTNLLRDHLTNLETVAMGLSENDQRNRLFAKRLKEGFKLLSCP